MAGLTGQRYKFTADSVANAPEGEGVYQIERADGTVVYIGSGRIRQRLQSHLRKDDPDTDNCIHRNAAAQYARELCANCRDRERQLLAVVPTLCNRRVG